MNKFKDIPTKELKELWDKKRREVLKGHTQAELDELLTMRKELDRRKGEKKPITNINFSEQYLTD